MPGFTTTGTLNKYALDLEFRSNSDHRDLIKEGEPLVNPSSEIFQMHSAVVGVESGEQ